MFLPEKATLSELNPGSLTPSLLPGLWKGDTITVTDATSYFAGGKTVMVQKDGYEEPVTIPACPAAAVEAAISDAVRKGVLWLLNGPASFQGEPVPAGVLTGSAQLRGPMSPILVDQRMQNELPEAWKDSRTSAIALSAALATKAGRPIPWTVLRRAIDDAIKSRWIELDPTSGVWPCDLSGASGIILKQPAQGDGLGEGKTPLRRRVSSPPLLRWSRRGSRT